MSQFPLLCDMVFEAVLVFRATFRGVGSSPYTYVLRTEFEVTGLHHEPSGPHPCQVSNG